MLEGGEPCGVATVGILMGGTVNILRPRNIPGNGSMVLVLGCTELGMRKFEGACEAPTSDFCSTRLAGISHRSRELSSSHWT